MTLTALLHRNHLKDRVMRLPCAHIFHQKCIIDWLTKHCTCPVCRYELETEDKQYEKSRKARMKCRKPRIHTYELERMPIHELQEMAKQWKIKWPRRIKGKKDILEAFEKSGRIEIIAAPEPVEYTLQGLRSMGVGKLRRTMENAGVFFDPIDVVEKEDMVLIFCNSGRLVLLPDKHTEEEDRKPPAADLPKPRSWEQPLDTEPDIPSVAARGPIVETVTKDEFVVEPEDGNATDMFESFDHELNTDRGVVEERIRQKPQDAPIEEVYREETNARANDGQELSVEEQPVNDQQAPVEEQDAHVQPGRKAMEEDEMQSESSNNARVSVHNDAEIAADYARFESYSISDLRDHARGLNVDLSQCIERREMVDKLVRAKKGQRFFAEDFDQWSVSDLRALATAVGADLSHCGDRTAMVQQLVNDSTARPYVANYVDSLMPLASLTVPQLRAVARGLRVDVSNCIEKEEMIHRLVPGATPSSANGNQH